MKKIFIYSLMLCVFAVVTAKTHSAFTGRSVQNTIDATGNDSVAQETPKAKVAEKVIDPKSIADQVIWVVGDEPILLSDVEMLKLQMQAENMPFNGDPDYTLPEQIAVQKLFLHQAALDSIEVTEAEIAQGVDQQINYWIQMIGSQEKLEEYKRMPLSQIRLSLHDDFKNNQLVQRMREKLVEDIKITPADVRRYFKDMPEDSIPLIPTQVEVQIITRQPKISTEELNRVKDELRNYTDRINKGEASFATLARLYSEDPGSARTGGEMDYIGRGMLDPAFAAVAFNLTDPAKISKIVESEFGFHIIQLIDKRGDKIKCRHILKKPRISQEAIDEGIARLDSVANDIREGKFAFEDAVPYVSDDKDTRSSKGLMSNTNGGSRTSKFAMKDLPTEVARAVVNMKPGEVSNAFKMVNTKGQTVCAIVKLKTRIESHRATITEDFEEMKEVVLNHERDKFLKDWVKKKIRDTYVRMEPRYRNYKYEYEGWIQ